MRTIADRLEKVERGELKRLIISCPPRHGKSYLVSQYFPAWYLCKNPEKNIIACSYGQELANDFGRSVRDNISNDRTTRIFGNVPVISDDSTSKKRFNTSKGGSYFAVGRGSPITGRGGDVIILDDLIKNEAEAQSSKVRESIIEWYKSTLRTRLMPAGAIVIIMTRWHQADLIGWLLANSSEEWEYLNFPAISKNRKALWPSRYKIGDLEKIEKEIGARKFTALYQGEPTTEEGNVIKREWLQWYSSLPQLANPEWVQSWDLAFKGNQSSDFVVGELWVKSDNKKYLVDQVRGRFDFVETVNRITEFSQRYPQAQVKLVEDAANGAAIYSHLKSKISGLILVKPTTSKDARLSAVSPQFEAKEVYLPNHAPWIEEYVEELVSFPYAKNDDQVDATTQALMRLANDSSAQFMTSQVRTVSSTLNTLNSRMGGF